MSEKEGRKADRCSTNRDGLAADGPRTRAINPGINRFPEIGDAHCDSRMSDSHGNFEYLNECFQAHSALRENAAEWPSTSAESPAGLAQIEAAPRAQGARHGFVPGELLLPLLPDEQAPNRRAPGPAGLEPYCCVGLWHVHWQSPSFCSKRKVLEGPYRLGTAPSGY